MELYIIGCGGNAKIIVDICELNGYTVKGFFDDKYNDTEQRDQIIYHQYKIIGNIKDIQQYPNINIINSIGDCSVRRKIYLILSNISLLWINCIHPESYISPTAELGHGNVICRGAVINSDTKIGNFNLVNTYAIIEHDCVIGDFNHFAPKSTVCGGVKIGCINLLGAGSTVIPGKTINNNNIIGSMSAIVTNFDSNVVITGIPGKILKYVT